METLKKTDHIPVMINEVLYYAAPQKGEIWIDGTFGAGGYSKVFLENSECQLIGVDKDPHVKSYAEQCKTQYPDRFSFFTGCFSQIDEFFSEDKKQGMYDGIMVDLGVSSMQLDQRERGFSFMDDGPLDMRMGGEGMSASDIVQTYPEEEIANILFQFGGEKKSRKIAKSIVEYRKHNPIIRTSQLVDIIKSAVKFYNDSINPATRSFQALRIHVNDELGALKKLLCNAENVLKEKGKLIVVSFHSLEDSLVKAHFRTLTHKNTAISRYRPEEPTLSFSSDWKIITAKAIHPSLEEIKKNPRARSAKLRAFQKISSDHQEEVL